MRESRILARPVLLRAGLIALLLATVLSVAISVAPSSPVAHAEGHNCVWNQIGVGTKTLPGTNDVLTSYLYAQYDTYSGAYCGYIYGKANIWVTKFNPGGTVSTILTKVDTAGHYTTLSSNTTTAANGGPGGWPTPIQTSVIYMPAPNCAYNYAGFGGYFVRTPTRCP